MKKLSDDDILKWLKSDEKSNFIDKEKLMLAKDLAIDIVSTNNLNFEHEVLVSLFNKDEYIKLMS